MWSKEDVDMLNRAHVSVPDRCPDDIKMSLSDEAIRALDRAHKKLPGPCCKVQETKQNYYGSGIKEPVSLRSHRRIW